MKRYGLVLAALLTLVLTAWAVCAATAHRHSGRRKAARGSETALLTAVWQYHHTQSRHWRNCLLAP
jgi:hypothetical protein